MSVINAIKEAKKLEGNESLLEILDGLKTSEKETKATLKDYTALKETIGEHDLGEVLGLYDALEKQGLTSAEGIVELQNKATGSEKTIVELKAEAEAFKDQVAEGAKVASDAQARAEERELVADAKTALISHFADGKAADYAINEDIKGGKLTRSEEGELLWSGKSISDSVDEMKNGREFLFAPAPSGTGVTSTPSNNGSVHRSSPNDWLATVESETK